MLGQQLAIEVLNYYIPYALTVYFPILNFIEMVEILDGSVRIAFS